MSEFEWLLFLSQLPAIPSSLRVNVWRRLRDAGATSLQNGVWILPRNTENKIFMQRLLAYVKQNDASGQIFLVKGLIRRSMQTSSRASKPIEIRNMKNSWNRAKSFSPSSKKKATLKNSLLPN